MASLDRPSLVRNADFVKLWTGQTISLAGTQVTLLALPLIAATILKVSPFEFGLLGTVEFLPFIFLSLPAGVWVDRLPRRPILIVGDAGRAISLATIPIAYALGVLTIWQLYAVGFVNGCLTVFFDVAYMSYLPALVEADQLVEGNSKLETTRSGSQIVGPSLAGVVITLASAPFAIILDAISYLVSVAFLIAIGRREPPASSAAGTADAPRPSVRTEAIEGLRYVLGQPYLRAIATSTGVSNLFNNILFATFILYLVRDLSFSPGAIGLLLSLCGVGFLAGALTANWIANLVGLGPAIIGASFLFGPSLLAIPLAPADIAMPVMVVAGFVSFGAVAVYNILQVSFRQAITPPGMQGRMNATMRFIVWGTIPVGLTIGGFLGGIIGLRATLLVGAIGSLTPFLPLLFSPLAGLRRMPDPAPNDAVDPVAVADPTAAPAAAPDVEVTTPAV